MVRTEASAEFGSSPLTRGKPCRPRPRSRSTRLIPAHAGKTAPFGPVPSGTTAHPRSRGENLPFGAKTKGRSGSSPLTRGKRSRGEKAGGGGGLIPAHAGKTFGCSCLNSSYAAHPRSRGENGKKSFKKLPAIGSSPLTRGKPLHRVDEAGDYRLIPAHAGKTRPGMPTARSRPAHPRSRGENPASPGQDDGTIGSSPLTRGKPAATLGELGGVRLIPAHAGKTRPAQARTMVRSAHPRSRGENLRRPSGSLAASGSSPLTRGKPAQILQIEIAARLIPAHAGKTSQRGGPLFYSEAHPRSRGENGRRY